MLKPVSVCVECVCCAHNEMLARPVRDSAAFTNHIYYLSHNIWRQEADVHPHSAFLKLSVWKKESRWVSAGSVFNQVERRENKLEINPSAALRLLPGSMANAQTQTP